MSSSSRSSALELSERTDHRGVVYRTQTEMFDAYSIPLATGWTRLNRYKWTLERVLTTPVKEQVNTKTCRGRKIIRANGKSYNSIKEFACAVGAAYGTVTRLLSLGVTPEEIVARYSVLFTINDEYIGNIQDLAMWLDCDLANMESIRCRHNYSYADILVTHSREKLVLAYNIISSKPERNRSGVLVYECVDNDKIYWLTAEHILSKSGHTLRVSTRKG